LFIIIIRIRFRNKGFGMTSDEFGIVVNCKILRLRNRRIFDSWEEGFSPLSPSGGNLAPSRDVAPPRWENGYWVNGNWLVGKVVS
jgi:hypothetical protein